MKGQKLLDVDHEEERGHEIALVKESRFLALVRRVRKAAGRNAVPSAGVRQPKREDHGKWRPARL